MRLEGSVMVLHLHRHFGSVEGVIDGFQGVGVEGKVWRGNLGVESGVDDCGPPSRYCRGVISLDYAFSIPLIPGEGDDAVCCDTRGDA